MQGLALNPDLLRVPLYIAGQSSEEIQDSLGIAEILKLNSNENPCGPSPMAIAALHAAIPRMHRYPGTSERDLRRKLALHHQKGLTEHHFIIGNGGTDVLRMIAQAFIFDGGESIASSVTFPLYALLTKMFGGRVVQVPLGPGYQMDLPGMADAITPHTRILWLCSPNNPTGLILTRQAVDSFLERVPEHVVVVFDEAYGDYVTDPEHTDSVAYIHQERNVIAVRSASKGIGLANLRVGYAIARPDLIEYLMHTVLPFNSGGLALRAAAAALDDHEFQRRSRELAQRERAFLYSRLTQMGFYCLPSQANFVLIVDPPVEAPALFEALLRQGVLVRPMAAFGLPNALRVTVGLREENERFLEAFQVALSEFYLPLFHDQRLDAVVEH